MADPSTPFNWAPLESDPEIFTKYFQRVGMSEQFAFQEVFGLDPDLIAMVPQPVQGLVLVFERLQEKKPEVENKGEAKFFMAQTPILDNACGLIASLHVLGNKRDSVAITEGSPLETLFTNMAKVETPAEKATILENFHGFHEVHNEFSNQGQSNLAQNQADVKHHFVSFIRTENGDLLELDGMKEAPKKHGSDITQEAFAPEVGKIILKMIEDKQVSESMSLMALVSP
eukprot:CAMPEP_0114995562 /NCGR_PEP_ID=MMETSP0216-20121206/13802_1 /TAXON_ID=223996 /ORGANISM="Protocruzia adherens, Strain Boccale" /LENGTH=228 /DNA_ID=CAMNT_0002359625 /DNA_START=41 /DNA_END=727 /DNA_ORIENTATION=-